MKKTILFISLITMLFSSNAIAYAGDMNHIEYDPTLFYSSQDNTYYIFYKDIDTAAIEEEIEQKRHDYIYSLFEEGLSQYEVDYKSNEYCQGLRIELLKPLYKEASSKILAELGINDSTEVFCSALTPLIVCSLNEEQLHIAQESENIAQITPFEDFVLTPDTEFYDKNSFIEMLTAGKDGDSVLDEEFKVDAILNSGEKKDTDFLIVYGLSDVDEINHVLKKLNNETSYEWVTPIEILYSGICYDLYSGNNPSQNKIRLLVFVNDIVPGLTSSEITSYSAGIGFDAKPYVINLGDINGDYFVDANDAAEILSAYAELSTVNSQILSDTEKAKMDIDKNGLIDSNDASLILSYYAYTSTSGSGLLGNYLKNSAT